MSGQFNLITGAGQAAEARVASALAPQQHTRVVSAKDDSQDSSSAATNNDITSSDFLTLLVSELKNQDPTQPTDPNAYITQLVGVNSLEQLIQINSGLSTVESASTTSGS